MAVVQWRFINQSDPGESIVVHDQASAMTLQRILELDGNASWVLQEERVLGGPKKAEPLKADSPKTEPPKEESIVDLVLPETESASTVPASASAPVAPPPPEVPRFDDRRSQPRFSTEFRVILVAGSQSFRTASKDVSLGGMKLREKIPHGFLSQKCIAYISHKDMRENIEVICEIVGDPSDPCRVKFHQPEPLRLKRLEEWIRERNGKAA